MSEPFDAGREEMLAQIEKLKNSPRWMLDHWWERPRFLITEDKAWENMRQMNKRLLKRIREIGDLGMKP